MARFNMSLVEVRFISQVVDFLRCSSERLWMIFLSLQSDCTSASTHGLLFLLCTKKFWRRPLVEPVCIASKPSNSSSSPSAAALPLFSLSSPALVCKMHRKTGLRLSINLLHVAAAPVYFTDILFYFLFFSNRAHHPSLEHSLPSADFC